VISLEFSHIQQIISILFAGICVGSFLNVVIYRVPRGKSIVKPSSRCGCCKSPLPFYRNIPIWSYLSSGGRCAQCGIFYSPRYLWVEILTPLLFLLTWWTLGWGLHSFFIMGFIATLMAGSFIDLDLRIIPDSLTLGAWAVTLLIIALAGDQLEITFMDAVLGSAVGYLSFYILSRGYALMMGDEGLGGGDVKLMGFIGAVLGWQGVVTTTFLASFLGLVVGLTLIFGMGKSRKYPLPFGPFLAAGAMAHALGFSVLEYFF